MSVVNAGRMKTEHLKVFLMERLYFWVNQLKKENRQLLGSLTLAFSLKEDQVNDNQFKLNK